MAGRAGWEHKPPRSNHQRMAIAAVIAATVALGFTAIKWAVPAYAQEKARNVVAEHAEGTHPETLKMVQELDQRVYRVEVDSDPPVVLPGLIIVKDQTTVLDIVQDQNSFGVGLAGMAEADYLWAGEPRARTAGTLDSAPGRRRAQGAR